MNNRATVNFKFDGVPGTIQPSPVNRQTTTVGTTIGQSQKPIIVPTSTIQTNNQIQSKVCIVRCRSQFR